jgi:hypothetical protein
MMSSTWRDERTPHTSKRLEWVWRKQANSDRDATPAVAAATERGAGKKPRILKQRPTTVIVTPDRWSRWHDSGAVVGAAASRAGAPSTMDPGYAFFGNPYFHSPRFPYRPGPSGYPAAPW